MPREDISISGYATTVVELGRALGLEEPVDVMGNSMVGFYSTESGPSHSAFLRRIGLCSAAGISITNLKRRPVTIVARVVAAAANFVIARSSSMIKRPGLRGAV